MNYRVFFHRGDQLSLKTRASKGRAWLDDVGLHIDTPEGLTIQASDILSAELFRLHGLGLVIQVEYRGGRLFLSVVRLMIEQFALINFFRTGELQKQLASLKKPA
jgi:hypothetical protein